MDFASRSQNANSVHSSHNACEVRADDFAVDFKCIWKDVHFRIFGIQCVLSARISAYDGCHSVKEICIFGFLEMNAS